MAEIQTNGLMQLDDEFIIARLKMID